MALLRRICDPPLTGGGGVGVTFLWRIFGLLTGGSNLRMASLRKPVGSHKIIEGGVAPLTFLRYLRDPPLTGGSAYRLAFLRHIVGSHN